MASFGRRAFSAARSDAPRALTIDAVRFDESQRRRRAIVAQPGSEELLAEVLAVGQVIWPVDAESYAPRTWLLPSVNTWRSSHRTTK